MVPSGDLLQVGDGVFEVMSTAGDTHLGGDDFDKRIVDFLADDFKRNEGIDLRKDRQVTLGCASVLVVPSWEGEDGGGGG